MDFAAELPATCSKQVSKSGVVRSNNPKLVSAMATKYRTQPSLPREPNNKRIHHKPEGLSVYLA